jgi:ABC-type transport system substrate-binding protein
MSGEVDMITSPGVRASEAAIARDQWVARGQGYLRVWETRLSFFEFQYREVPNWQRALTDVRVRQALIQSVDRQGLVDAVNEGLGSPGDAFVVPSDPLFADIDRAIVKYPFDPNRAVQTLEEAGWRRTPAGPVVSAAGAPLEVEMMSGASQGKAATIIGDNWKAAGITSSLNIMAPARERDREYRANFPGTQINGRSVSLENFHFVSGQLPRPETGFVELNRGSFYDAEVERLHHIAMTSFDAEQRRSASVGFQERMSRLAGYAPLYYSVEVILAKHKVKGPIGNYGPQIGTTWNVFEWEVTE